MFSSGEQEERFPGKEHKRIAMTKVILFPDGLQRCFHLSKFTNWCSWDMDISFYEKFASKGNKEGRGSRVHRLLLVCWT